MMFLKIPKQTILLIWVFLQFISFTVSTDSPLSSNISKFIKETQSYKLENYLRKMKLKNFGIWDKDKDNFIFVDSDAEYLIINSMEDKDLGYDQGTKADVNNFDDFKARLFAFIAKNQNNPNDGSIYIPIGVNRDEEKIPKWNVFLVLMNYSTEKHKLIKVCFPVNDTKGNFAIVFSKFDEKCGEYAKKIEEKKILNTEDKEIETKNKLRSMQSKLLSFSLKEKIDHDIKKNMVAPNSFLEKAAVTVNTILQTGSQSSSSASASTKLKSSKMFSFADLEEKFSLDELSKIKSLIKFAKENNIIDEIHNKKGNLKLADLMKNIQQPVIGNNTSAMRQNGNLPLDEKMLNLFFNGTKNSLIQMNNILVFVKELTSEFHKSMLQFGNSLETINEKLRGIHKPQVGENKEVPKKTNASPSISSLNKNKPNAQIRKSTPAAKNIGKELRFKQTQLAPSKSAKPPAGKMSPSEKAQSSSAKPAAKISPFLTGLTFDTDDDDDDDLFIEKSIKKKHSSRKATSISIDDEDDFINP